MAGSNPERLDQILSEDTLATCILQAQPRRMEMDKNTRKCTDVFDFAELTQAINANGSTRDSSIIHLMRSLFVGTTVQMQAQKNSVVDAVCSVGT
ncbi:hypothetical protein HOE425_330995 [Hoeflea sp. EC-HK425]|nr:hypothetical protein HOE425_330995 [Hoeflea sp. EC-HK425]